MYVYKFVGDDGDGIINYVSDQMSKPRARDRADFHLRHGEASKIDVYRAKWKRNPRVFKTTWEIVAEQRELPFEHVLTVEGGVEPRASSREAYFHVGPEGTGFVDLPTARRLAKERNSK